MPDAAFRLWTSASAVPFFLLLDSSSCCCCCCYCYRCRCRCCGCLLHFLLAAFCLLLGLHAAAGFFLLPAAVGVCLLPGFPLGERVRGSFGPRSDLDRTSIGSRLLMQKSGFEAIPLLAVSATAYHIALPIGFVRLRQASSCLLPTSWGAEFWSVHNGKTMFHVQEDHAGRKCNWIWLDVALPIGFVRQII